MPVTPMLQQYYRIKEENPGTILLFRLGDFYETFYDDAMVASRELGIVLTGRDAGEGKRAPMAGVPYHSADSYIARLVARGYKVAICEQMEDPRSAKGLVKREVTRIITPGTVTDDRMLNSKANNYIVCVVGSHEIVSLGVADVSTGQFYLMEAHGAEAHNLAAEELRRLQPAECIFGGILDDSAISAVQRVCRSSTVIEPLGLYEAESILKRHFGVSSLYGFGCQGMESGIVAAGTLLQYVMSNQRGQAGQIRSLSTHTFGEGVMIDSDSRRNLELLSRISDGGEQGSLIGTMDCTVTPMGARMLRRTMGSPMKQVTPLNMRLDAVSEITRSALLRKDLRGLLSGIRDIERLLSRVSARTCGGRELLFLKSSLGPLPDIRAILASANSQKLLDLAQLLPDLSPVVDTIESAISPDAPVPVTEGGVIRTGYSEEVDRLREMSTQGKGWIASLEARERERSGIRNLRVGFNRVFGYYIEVTNANQKSVPDDYTRKQTLTGAERYITPELKKYEDAVLHAEERLASLEYEVFCAVREQVATYSDKIQQAAAAVAEIDLLSAFAELAITNGYCRPNVDDGFTIDIKDARHPVVETIVGGSNFVPNDILLDSTEQRLLIITGPNMAGKSTYARSAALITIMAQMGSFVPAREATIGVVDRVFARVGASDDLSLGRSTFMVEMTEVANILNNATQRSLVILDEVGRGTGTYDGMSLAWAISEDLCSRIRARTILTTHYHQLTELEDALPGTRNYKVSVKEKGHEVVFLHRIVRGWTDRSYGIQVARLAGVPPEVVERAGKVLEEIEAEISFRRQRREVTSKKKKESNQLGLLLPEPVFEVLMKLRSLDPSNTTPMQALEILEALAQKAKE